MKIDYNYYKLWYNKWIRVFRYLCDKCDYKDIRIQKLIDKVKTHWQLIEWRMLCYRWFGEDAESNDLFPKHLKGL